MKILINAYACSPNMGSEPGMAWNWCVNLAKHCELHIITEGEFREKIETELPMLKQNSNMHFYYNPVSEKVRRMCWNQGDWRFYYYYKKWQKKTADIARAICKKEQIDILHQLNMIGFREPGYLWKVSQETGIPFVWGPIGGLKMYPMTFAKDKSIKMKLFLWLKNQLTLCQLKYDKRINQAFKSAVLLISSIPDSKQAIRKYKDLDSIIIPETGTFPQQEFPKDPMRFHKDLFTILWVGKFDFRKRLDLAINTISILKKTNKKILLKILGTGSDKQINEYRALANQLGVENSINWMGNLSNEQVKKEMQQADLFLFTSVNEDTSTVVLEAISNHLPVLCFDICGMSAVINEKVGIKIPATNPERANVDFARKIDFLYHHRDRLTYMSENCIKQADELSWDKKALQVIDHYKTISDDKRKKYQH